MSAQIAASKLQSGTTQGPAPGGGDGSLGPEQMQAKFELGVATALFNWSALTLAVQNQWGGADSEGKREWFAGAIIEMFEGRRQTEIEDVEATLLQVMLDEFDVNVDDESAFDLAKQILRIRQLTLAGAFDEVDALHKSWVARKGKNSVKFQRVQDDDGDTDWDTDDDGEEGSDGDEDVDMADAPTLVSTKKEKPPPEVDEEGFTTVVGKKRR
ncbi:MAG: hypothetical protein M4579_002222 [Chaenotheca gracillima]|nr:MAG: hypothetical protein M4579_002222 [Chaenotheca gracillima]